MIYTFSTRFMVCMKSKNFRELSSTYLVRETIFTTNKEIQANLGSLYCGINFLEFPKYSWHLQMLTIISTFKNWKVFSVLFSFFYLIFIFCLWKVDCSWKIEIKILPKFSLISEAHTKIVFGHDLWAFLKNDHLNWRFAIAVLLYISVV